jgi:hypothetical protein
MASGPEKRKNERVTFTREVPVRIQAIDGTWTRNSVLLDVSDNGAKLRLKESVEALRLKEFFLILSTTGAVFRRCELAWVNGDEMGVHFLAKTAPPTLPRKTGTDRATHEV